MKSIENILFNVNEIFYSIQGESTLAGLPCVFIRLQGCNLRCDWCDTDYALEIKKQEHIISFDDIIKKVKSYCCNFVCITGGEPLVQENVILLMNYFVDNKYIVSLETNNSYSLINIDKRVKKIVDFKPPSSKMSKGNNFDNINYLTINDEIKFVIADRQDYLWSKDIIKKYNLEELVNSVLMSTVFNRLDASKLAEWILQDNLHIRLQLQLHKILWDTNQRGV